jgi:hypothetical protein
VEEEFSEVATQPVGFIADSSPAALIQGGKENP